MKRLARRIRARKNAAAERRYRAAMTEQIVLGIVHMVHQHNMPRDLAEADLALRGVDTSRLDDPDQLAHD